jgi:uncharacterized repeat protein (TIGR01451 family)
MDADSAIVSLGDSVTFSLGVTNLGPASAPAVVLNDTLPAGFDILSTNVSQGSVSIAGGALSWDIGDLQAGTAASLTLVTTPTHLGNFINVASVSGAVTDQDPGNDSSQVTGTVVSSVHVTLSGSFSNGLFQLTITGQPNTTYVSQASSDLSSWVPISTNTASGDGTITFSDPSTPNNQTRFYRAVEQTP